MSWPRRASPLGREHGLDTSAFTARCVASTGARPYMAVSGALAALSGPREGGRTARVGDLFDEQGGPRAILVARLRRGEEVPGFGHPLYPGGDPRGAALMELGAGAGHRRARAFAKAAEELLDRKPNLDFGLVALARALELPADAPLVLFAPGRTVGWIAHCIEQCAGGELIRPGARDLGPAPGE